MEPNISIVASLIGDQARSKMLTALMGGKALTATELAIEADITAQTASNHLAKLVSGDLLTVRKQGRHKYFQLKNAEVAGLIEQLSNISASMSHAKVKTGPGDPRLRRSRICYDHLAGELAVALYDALLLKGVLVERQNEASLSPEGKTFFQNLVPDFTQLTHSKRALCKSCLDWSERRNHLAGNLGQWILSDLIKQKWAVKDLDSRAIQFTPLGLKAFTNRYGIGKEN